MTAYLNNYATKAAVTANAKAISTKLDGTTFKNTWVATDLSKSNDNKLVPASAIKNYVSAQGFATNQAVSDAISDATVQETKIYEKRKLPGLFGFPMNHQESDNIAQWTISNNGTFTNTEPYEMPLSKTTFDEEDATKACGEHSECSGFVFTANQNAVGKSRALPQDSKFRSITFLKNVNPTDVMSNALGTGPTMTYAVTKKRSWDFGTGADKLVPANAVSGLCTKLEADGGETKCDDGIIARHASAIRGLETELARLKKSQMIALP